LNGNQIAEKTLYEKYKKIVRDFIFSKYSTYYDIDDDVSEILIKIFLNIKIFDSSKSKFKTWVITITKNYMIDKWRCNTSESSNTVMCTLNNYNNQTTTDSNISFTSSNSTSNFEYNNTVTYLSTQLSPIDYTLLNMKYIQGYSYDEIGREFQISSSTVSNKINYIKTKLKKNIPEDILN